MTCLQGEEINAFVSGEMPTDQLATASVHLQTCDRCQRVLASAKGAEQTADGVVPNRLVVPPSAELPAKIGPYVVLDQLGEGGMGSVYTAYHPQLERKVAIKVLRSQSAHVEESSRAHARLIREAQSMAQLDDPHVVAIHDVGSIDGQVYLVMDRVDGVSMSQWLKDKPRDWREVQKVMVQAGRGLVAAHAAGIIHRDFKPANVLVGNDGRVRVADFGIARKNSSNAISTEATPSPDHDTNPSGEVLTQAGRMVGTPIFMAPEQFADAPADARSDQFSFCVSLYGALYGEKPYRSVNGGIGIERFTRPPMPPSNTKEPKFIREAVLRGLSVDPAQRFESMQALLAQLERQPLTWRKVAPWAAVAAVVFTSGVAGWWVTRPPPIPGCEADAVKLVGTWDAQAREALRKGFGATGAAAATLASERVVSAFDTYGLAWGQQQAKLCAAALGQPLDSPLFGELKCLELQKMHYRAVVEVLTKPTADMIDVAELAAASLMPPSRCADPHALSSLPRTPSDLALREKVQALRFQIANGLALNLAGQPRRALAALTPLVARAAQLKFQPLDAEAREALAETNALLANGAQAAEDFRLAARSAEVTGQDALAANANAAGAFFVAYLGKREAAEMMLEHAEVLHERAGYDPFIQSQIDNSKSLLEALALHLDKSLAHQRRATQLRRDVFGPTHPRTLYYLMNLAQAELDQCHPAEAEHELKVFDAPEAAQWAPSIYSRGLVFLSVAQTQTGDLEGAQRALGLADAVIAPESFSGRAEWGWAKAILLLKLGNGTGALEAARQAATAADHIGAEAPLNVYAREAVAAALVALGQGADASGRLERELPTHQKVLGADQLKAYYVTLAAAYLDAKQLDKAMVAATRALQEQTTGCVTPEERATLSWLTAQILKGQKADLARSRALARSARESFAAMPWNQRQVAAIDAFLKP